MAPRVIKQGTARASIVQQFSFAENAEIAMPLVETPMWPELPSIPVTTAGKTVPEIEAPSPAADLAHVEKNAYENGFRQGEKAGMEIAERKMEVVMRRYADAILEVNKLRSSLYVQVEHEVVKLAIAVAKKIVHREIQVDRDIIQTLVRVALSHVAEKSSVTIHLNPTDYNYLLELRAELSQSEGRDIALLSDKSIERGGCLIQTDCGDIDARVQEEFREVEHAFFEGLK
jgi:flagellar biosynthesis/type III secretory pathway protein FliH